jgi:hypothetical protein
MSDSADVQIERHKCMGGCGLSSPPSEWFCYSAHVGGYLCRNCLEEAVVSASPSEDEEAEAEGASEDYGLPPVSACGPLPDHSALCSPASHLAQPRRVSPAGPGGS